jgi:imidazoleglycerol-phosphate dehydratase
MRVGKIERKTNETDISLSLCLDGKGEHQINTGCGFFDHMLTLFASHSGYDLNVFCKGDVEVDYHHTVEDIGIALGQAFFAALGDKKGICRYGDIILPMDETLILCALDISGRDYLAFDSSFPSSKVGDFDTELCEEFFRAFVRCAGITLHIKKMAGTNTHHIIEGIFKAFARALAKATKIDESKKDVIPSSKGVI